MKMNLKNLINNYGGQWIALNKNTTRVIANSKSAQKTYDDAKKGGNEIPKLYKVPVKYIPYIG